MKKRLIMSLGLLCLCLCLTGCSNEHDGIEVYNKSGLVFDNIMIETEDGYFYDGHEKFFVDGNTVGVTIYFSTEEGD